jgi:hypothetical protein
MEWRPIPFVIAGNPTAGAKSYVLRQPARPGQEPQT